MAKFELRLPKMGESVAEATITSWLKSVGDRIETDEAIVEIATDKVDSEVPSEVSGTLVEILYEVNAVVQVGAAIAIIETDESLSDSESLSETPEKKAILAIPTETTEKAAQTTEDVDRLTTAPSGKFYSPLVRNIAAKEGISMAELEMISGSGKDQRVTKKDILAYLEKGRETAPLISGPTPAAKVPNESQSQSSAPVSVNGADEIIEMSRMGKLIAKHMVDSVQTAAHVQSFIEVDVTPIVKWRNAVKEAYFAREGEKITYTPVFMQAVAMALKQFPMMNISVDGTSVIKRKDINLGMAAALPDGNLIVPVIKHADRLSLTGMTRAVNDLANRARNGALAPDEIQGGTYTVTNVGGFGSVFGTPIINQPQVGILALGAIRKVPAVIETDQGDFIGIRHKMFLSHSYDHRVVNGALGGSFIKKIKEVLEAWDENTAF